MVLTLGVYGAVSAGIWLNHGMQVAVTGGLLLPLMGWGFAAWFHRVRSILRLSRLAAARIVVGRGLFGRLGAERAELRDEVDALINRYVPDDMERLFDPVAERTDG